VIKCNGQQWLLVLYHMVIQLRLEAFQLKNMLMDSHPILCCYLLLLQLLWTKVFAQKAMRFMDMSFTSMGKSLLSISKAHML
jgi:hypothetical protein